MFYYSHSLIFKDVLEHACAGLEKKIELTVDGRTVELPEIEGLVVLNIPFWGAGVRPWGESSDMPQAIDDGVVIFFFFTHYFYINFLLKSFHLFVF